MRTKFDGGIPKNARIKIDYRGEKPKVSFSYPSKKNQVTGSLFFEIKIMSIILIYIFLSFYYRTFSLISESVGIILLCLLIYPIAIIIYYPFKKFWLKLYPKVQAFESKKKLVIFQSKDIRYSNEFGFFCEIIMFSNIILDFKATEQFSKYLTLVEIKEHKFKYYNRYRRYLRRIKRAKRKGKNISKIKDESINEWYWYARFYFSEKPMKGFLKVLFK